MSGGEWAAAPHGAHAAHTPERLDASPVAEGQAPVDATPPDRLVFFFSGFDPKGAGYYHRLYREGAATRSGFGDMDVKVGPRRRMGELASACDIEWRADGEDAESPPVRTRLHFMRWDDIVRRHWLRSAWQLVGDYAGVYGIGLPNGDFARIWRKSRAAWGMAIFPLVVALVAMGITAPLLWTALRHRDATSPLVSALGAGLGAVMMWRWIVRRIDCEWLLRLYAFTRAQALGTLPDLEARLDAMATWVVARVTERLAADGAEPLREVMFVGYSTGSTVASAVLARAQPGLQALLGEEGPGVPALSMLTLGHCVPIAADWGGARRVREEMQRLGAWRRLTWHDWSSPADWAAFWRTPPWPEGSVLQGVQRSPRFHTQLSAEAYAALKRDRREMHLQYLRSPGRAVEPTGYDWFRFTAGPDVLGTGVPPSSPAGAPVPTPAAPPR